MGKLALLISAGLAGGALGVLPGLAGAQAGTVAVTAKDYTFTPATQSVAAGSAVTFAYPSGSDIHNVRFTAAAPTACTGSTGQVGSTPRAAAPGWSATCTFNTPGTYPFLCTEHGVMKGTITVTPAATTPPPSGTGTPPGQTPPPGGATPPPGGTTTTPGSTPPPSGTPSPVTDPGAPLGGLVADAVQHGTVVHGQLTIAGSGSSLFARLLDPATTAAHGARSTLGHMTRHGLKPGVQSFSVRLSRRGRRALAAHQRLALTLEVKLVDAAGATTTARTAVVLTVAPVASPRPAGHSGAQSDESPRRAFAPALGTASESTVAAPSVGAPPAPSLVPPAVAPVLASVVGAVAGAVTPTVPVDGHRHGGDDD